VKDNQDAFNFAGMHLSLAGGLILIALILAGGIWVEQRFSAAISAPQQCGFSR
jgi:hypothetical protein